VYRWRPKLAQHPLTGFCLTLGVSLLRSGLIFLYAPHSRAAPHRFEDIGMAPVLQGLGTALILAILEQVRDRDGQTRAAASAEARALQSRMNPHFLFNALNGLAALSRVAPRQVPRATGQLRHFLRASFDQHERLLVKAKRGQVKYRKKRGTRYPIPSTDVSGLLCWPDFAQAHGTD